MAGFSQIFITIYLPLYVDAYMTKVRKPGVLSLLLVAAPLGVVAGYAMTSVCILKKGYWKTEYNFFWYQSFRVQSVFSLFAAVVILFVPSKFIDLKQV